MTIDAAKLRTLLTNTKHWTQAGGASLHSSDFALLHAAASAYVATLPREVEVEAWAVLRPDGSIWGLYEQDSATTEIMRERPEYIPVRLTGTAVIKPEV